MKLVTMYNPTQEEWKERVEPDQPVFLTGVNDMNMFTEFVK
jgi:hypothetical protein